MIRVLFVIWSLENGGAERFLVALLKSLDREKVEPVVCCLNWKGRWAPEVEEKGVTIIALDKKMGVDPKAFFRLLRVVREGKFDVVNTHLWTADWMGRLAAILARVPVVITTAQNVDVWKKWWHIVADKFLSYKTDAVIAVSEAVKEYYHKTVRIPLGKIVSIPNAVEIERYENAGDVRYLHEEFGYDAGNFVIACVGRLTGQKGQRYLLESLVPLKAKYPFLRTLFIGYGEDRGMLEGMAAGLGLSETVRFLGGRNDIPQLLKFCNVLVLPSIYEGLPLCVLEAMAAARPVIATDVGGVRQLVKDGENGFVVPARNPGRLTEAIEAVLERPDKGLSMGLKGHAIAKHEFAIGPVAERTTNLFESLLRQNV